MGRSTYQGLTVAMANKQLFQHSTDISLLRLE